MEVSNLTLDNWFILSIQDSNLEEADEAREVDGLQARVHFHLVHDVDLALVRGADEEQPIGAVDATRELEHASLAHDPSSNTAQLCGGFPGFCRELNTGVGPVGNTQNLPLVFAIRPTRILKSTAGGLNRS